jgi:hypothetical protein
MSLFVLALPPSLILEISWANLVALEPQQIDKSADLGFLLLLVLHVWKIENAVSKKQRLLVSAFVGVLRLSR